MAYSIALLIWVQAMVFLLGVDVEGWVVRLLLNPYQFLSTVIVGVSGSVSTCYVPSREEVAGRNEVEFLRGFHSVPAQVTASRGRDWGGPVFDSPMLKAHQGYLDQVIIPYSQLSQSALDWGLSRGGQLVRAWLGTKAYVASQSALDWGLSRSGQSVRAWLGTEAYVASQSALDWGLSRGGQSVRAWLGTKAYVASQSALDWGLSRSGQSVRAWLGTEAYVASQSALDWGLSRGGQSVRA
ncbi:hypothetical protein ACLB2K_047934 [Fragaria x ananassa]